MTSEEPSELFCKIISPAQSCLGRYAYHICISFLHLHFCITPSTILPSCVFYIVMIVELVSCLGYSSFLIKSIIISWVLYHFVEIIELIMIIFHLTKIVIIWPFRRSVEVSVSKSLLHLISWNMPILWLSINLLILSLMDLTPSQTPREPKIPKNDNCKVDF